MIRLGVLNKEKALLLSQQGFFFVDKRFGISNLDLVNGMDKIYKLDEVLKLLSTQTKEEIEGWQVNALC